VTRTDSYYTASPHQSAVHLHIYQGDDADALKNILVGHFTIEGLTRVQESNEVLCRMSLDLDGILRVTAIEKRSGKSKQIVITEALTPKSEEEIAEARKRLEALYSARSFDRHDLFVDDEGGWEEDEEEEAESPEQDESSVTEARQDATDPAWDGAIEEARRLLARSRSLLDRMHDEDKEETVDLNEAIENAMADRDTERLSKWSQALKELLFFVEGR
jgi:molecular chaperone DnaK (HSP70)